MTIFDVEIGALDGGLGQSGQYRSQAALVVTMAPRWGLTPQDADGAAAVEKPLPR